MTSRGQAFVDEIANALLERLGDGKHICKYEHQMGRMEALLKKIDDSVIKQEKLHEDFRKDVTGITNRVVQLEAERGTLKWIVGLIGGGSFGSLIWTLFK